MQSPTQPVAMAVQLTELSLDRLLCVCCFRVTGRIWHRLLPSAVRTRAYSQANLSQVTRTRSWSLQNSLLIVPAGLQLPIVSAAEYAAACSS